ncbi:MAG: C39 family peptidase [Planctomycetota bacterium]
MCTSNHDNRHAGLRRLAISLAAALSTAATFAQMPSGAAPPEQPDIGVTLLPDFQAAQAWAVLGADGSVAPDVDGDAQLALARGCDATLLDGAWHSAPGGLIRALGVDQVAALDAVLPWGDLLPPQDGWFVLYRLDAASSAPTPLPEPALADVEPADEEDLCLPAGPPPVGGYEPYPSFQDGERVITGVPAYRWRHGCGPTSAGMVIGYWDGRGCSWLITGDASTQTASVNLRIASGDDVNGHYRDFSKPLDDSSTGIKRDMSQAATNTHSNHCLADFMHTSWSLYGKYYGATTRDHMPPGIVNFIDTMNLWNGTSYQFESSLESWATPSWSKLVYEIDNNRPVVLRVDSDGDGAGDHYVTGIGYRDTRGYQEYACFDTWGTGTRWERFRAVSSSYAWGITHVIYVRPKPPTNLVASDGSSGDYVKLTWNAVYAATGYSVWRSTVNDPNTAAYLCGRTQNYYYDWSVGRGIRYYYWVRAGFNNAMSERSAGEVGWRR